MILLYVDDLRPAPEGWHLARTITEAIRVLATMEVSEVSLDHDIACPHDGGGYCQNHLIHETFEPVCRYITLLNDCVLDTNIKVYCHSGNPTAYDKYSNILGERVQPLATREI